MARYGIGTTQERDFHRRRIKNGKLFVALRTGEDYLFAPSKFAGYKGNDLTHQDYLRERDGRVTNRILDQIIRDYRNSSSPSYAEIDDVFLNYCAKFEIESSRHHRLRRYWVITRPVQAIFADEILEGSGLFEGAKQRVIVNRYERSPEARRQCIEHYGNRCLACGINFEEKYGVIGKGYIHVHHIVSLADIDKRYQVDPITDLRPVCPNCHAMLHQTDPALTIEELHRILQNLPAAVQAAGRNKKTATPQKSIAKH
ncbi:MAG: HNH endonuclease [Alphaproteobacteria bacterium]|nr:HNH endonuclease [Alphaproteobacteria bacterium]